MFPCASYLLQQTGIGQLQKLNTVASSFSCHKTVQRAVAYHRGSKFFLLTYRPYILSLISLRWAAPENIGTIYQFGFLAVLYHHCDGVFTRFWQEKYPIGSLVNFIALVLYPLLSSAVTAVPVLPAIR